MLDNQSRRHLQIAIASLAMLVLSGCAMMDTAGDKSLALPTDAQAAATPATTVTVEIRASGKKPDIKQLQVDNDSTVQQMLEKTGLVKRFRRMNIEILRATRDQRARLDVKYDHTQAQVKPEYDYALHAGDHVIVKEVTKTAFDDMLESVSGPLGRATGAR